MTEHESRRRSRTGRVLPAAAALALALLPGVAAAERALPAALRADYLRGQELIAAGELDQAAWLWEELVATAAAIGDGRWRDGLALAMGETWWKAGAWERARTAYDAALAADADPGARATVLERLGHLASRRGELEAAARWREQALALRHDLAPGSLAEAESLNNLGTVMRRRGEPERAEADPRSGLRAVPLGGFSGLRRLAVDTFKGRVLGTGVRIWAAVMDVMDRWTSIESMSSMSSISGGSG